MGNNWTAMFETRRGGTAPLPDQTAAPVVEAFDDADIPGIDSSTYRPWIVQRGRSNAAMMLALRWFDAKAELWHGAAIAYPSLYAIDTLGDRAIALDFGTRQYVIEGHGLDVLTRHLLQGSVLKIVEYNSTIWPVRDNGPVVSVIRKVGGE